MLDDPPDGIDLLVGGGNPAILRAAARSADVVALSGLGRTLPDGHRHEVRWSRPDLDRQLALVREAAGGRSPMIDALVQVVEVTDDRERSLAALAERVQAPVEDLAATPFLLVGSHDEMAAQLRRQADELGITSYVVREPAVDDLVQVMARLPG